MTRNLDVYLHEKNAGRLTQDGSGELTFAYTQDYLSDNEHPAISIAMPMREDPWPDRIARPWFSGLLPDERARKQLASVLGVSAGNAFGLLEIIGGEEGGPGIATAQDLIAKHSNRPPLPHLIHLPCNSRATALQSGLQDDRRYG